MTLKEACDHAQRSGDVYRNDLAWLLEVEPSPLVRREIQNIHSAITMLEYHLILTLNHAPTGEKERP